MINDPVSGPNLPTPPIPPAPSVPPLPPPIIPPFDPGAAVRHWARILLARNPFYIVSAALLLWSMRRLSLDSRIFPREFPQLLFNFSSFQVYELLLAGTAIALARRRIWYDAGLLVGLENLFVCVPFLLVSQALLLENWTAFALCLTGCGLALLRVSALKHWLKELNMPARLLWPGAFLLCFNFVWPVLIRYLHKDLAVPDWDQRGLALTSWEWNWIIPAAVALAAILPSKTLPTGLAANEELPFYAWRSFPLLALFLWISGTGVHLYCISYVYGLPWRVAYVAPGVWMAAWMLWRQVNNLAPVKARGACQRILLLQPTLIVLACAWTERRSMGLTLALLNTLACGAISFVRRDRLALHLCAVSALLVGVFLPHPASVGGGVGLAEALCGGGLIYMVGWAVLSARPKLGILGGLCLGIGLAGLLPTTTLTVNFAVQAGLIFILLHSIRWIGAAKSDAATARKICGAYWLIHTVVWVMAKPSNGIHVTMACGASVLAVYACARFILGGWGPAAIAYCAGAVVCWGPLYLAGVCLLRAPDGLLTLLGSFALFGLGTLAAFMKVRLATGAKSSHSR